MFHVSWLVKSSQAIDGPQLLNFFLLIFFRPIYLHRKEEDEEEEENPQKISRNSFEFNSHNKRRYSHLIDPTDISTMGWNQLSS